jgi:hypothetical protein
MGELLAALLQAILEFFGEMLLQLFAEFAVELFSRMVRALFAAVRPTAEVKEPDPVGAFILYTVLGGLMGLLSVKLVPAHLIHTSLHRWLNLVITPLIIGWAMASLGRWHDKNDRRVVGLDKFFSGWGFALAFAIARFMWCR